MRRLIQYFFQGLLYIVPVAILAYVVVKLFNGIGSLLNQAGVKFHPLFDPIIGIVSFLLIVTFIGFIGSFFIFKPFFLWVDDKLERTPLVKTVYTSVKDVMNAFVGSKKKFNKPVLVKLSSTDECYRLGFVTHDDLAELSIAPDKVAVYLPFSYAISGTLYIVPRKNITPIDASAADVMKLIISGGITEVDKEH